MEHAAEFRRCLVDADVAGLRRLWAHAFPGIEVAQTHGYAETVLHIARTEAQSVDDALRALSHRWLTERGLPSRLPQDMRPLSERHEPRIVSGVGISVVATTPSRQGLADAMHAAMADAVEDAYAHGLTDPAFVSARMDDARLRVLGKD